MALVGDETVNDDAVNYLTPEQIKMRDRVKVQEKALDLRTRIAAIQLAHMGDQYEQDMGECPCGFRYSTTPELAAHVADALIRELKLQPETKHNPGGAILTRLDGKMLADTRHQYRWVTPWENDESPVK